MNRNIFVDTTNSESKGKNKDDSITPANSPTTIQGNNGNSVKSKRKIIMQNKNSSVEKKPDVVSTLFPSITSSANSSSVVQSVNTVSSSSSKKSSCSIPPLPLALIKVQESLSEQSPPRTIRKSDKNIFGSEPVLPSPSYTQGLRCYPKESSTTDFASSSTSSSSSTSFFPSASSTSRSSRRKKDVSQQQSSDDSRDKLMTTSLLPLQNTKK